MSDFNVYHQNYKTRRVKIEGRTFQIEFWDVFSLSCRFPYARVSEIVTEQVKPHWFSRKTKVREVKREIDSGWMNQNRLDWAMARIDQYLQEERDDMEELRQIEAFCSGTD